MNVYQTDIDGVFVGITTADQDPLDESNMLIPAGCVETAPPSTTETQLARWNGSAWSVEDIHQPAVEPELTPQDPAEVARSKRNGLLAETDWWAVQDRTMTAEEIAYRQALRDVPAQDGFPNDVVWPIKPE